MLVVFRIYILSLLISLKQVACLDDLDGYIIEASSDCSSLSDDTPTLKILSDFSVMAKARCVDGDQEFETTDGVNYLLPATFTSGNDRCQLIRRKQMFYVEVVVLFGSKEARILGNSKTYTLVCSFDDKGKSLSDRMSIIEGTFVPGEMVKGYVSSIDSSHITLKLQDVMDNDIGTDISVDNYVSLLATSDGANSEVGLKPISCDVISDKANNRYNILRSGCGLGQFFKKGAGFTTKGKTARSPYFKLIMLDNDDTVQFDCQFALCSGNCDGTSCEDEN
ncbi:hypothetical protein LOTGIDRAFT_229975 [Lottia gigantea]|uniref:ZP domain-containing protein n=1 Tax=Lottia gigantea TaxID=225164 RepID=V4AL35_LOTGI|nr:hypothetical protein LOTGIDRAFT_229975 [Lottia gigantea]ESP04894.1 hypothetical protein LOTGIDRAFT_229975 [Lottia gigantea]